MALTGAERCLLRLAAALCSSRESVLRAALGDCLQAGVEASSLRAVIHTSYLFDGYPAALEGFRILAELTGPANSGAPIRYDAATIELWRRRGEEFCRRVYGPQFERLTQRVGSIAPELADAMLVEGYGKVLSSEELSPRLRELCVTAMLIAKGRRRQLLSHAIGALRVGAKSTELLALPQLLDGVVEATFRTSADLLLSEAVKVVGQTSD